ncbi:glutaminase A [Deinococcus cellulosilyticus]|uniref:Glutaminase n=1 Tax=Deinococcus cellulosilyticus (strain DSM 18568 / NBRC 106333 / KACC 11606 / 5516J-15) TaxID=1223518 RepID=A0A511N495_DEIC1|nr:glutaminase A [Deinococcus cellulosilyticus]GEM47288.1 hypothetical protein DC3_29230 [Deinococcus cellulosilyticus NBRC 106333 = KACC 11606]
MTEPDPLPELQAFLDELHQTLASDLTGDVAHYIPELATSDPHTFAISITTKNGRTFQAGDVDVPFTLQSVSKPFSYALALQDIGCAEVLQHVNVEPSGNPFNSIRLDEGRSVPDNPMINAGALVVSSLLLGKHQEKAFERLLDLLQDLTGKPPRINLNVLQSENSTAHRNRAIVYLMRNLNMLDQDPEKTLQLYLQQCALEVTCADLSMMAATLASGGVHPLSGQRIFDPAVVRAVLSVMYSCGMYNSAGDWGFRVGLPAKSGVSGGLMAVAPGQMGIAIYSAKLDAHGHSHRGVLACQRIAERLGLHLFSASGVLR